MTNKREFNCHQVLKCRVATKSRMTYEMKTKANYYKQLCELYNNKVRQQKTKTKTNAKAGKTTEMIYNLGIIWKASRKA